MNQPPGPPGPPDPNALTQPIPIVAPPPPPRSSARPPYVSRPAFAPRFGNVPLYLLARLAARTIDLFAIAFVLTSFGFAAFDRGLQTFAGRDQAGFGTLGGGSLAVGFLFAYLCEALTGSTLGKLTFGLHTRRGDGGHAGGGRVFARYLLLPIDLLVIGPLLALVTRRHQRLGDLVGGTVVSGSRIGFLAPVLGVAMLGGLGYAQVAYAGGLSTAIEVAAATSNVAPGFVTKAAQLAGFGTVRFPAPPVSGIPLVKPSQAASTPESLSQSPQPLVSPSAELAPSPQASPDSDVPSSQASQAANVERPGYPTDAPENEATSEPDAQPSDRIVTQ